LLEEFFEQFGLRGMTYARRSESSTLFLESATSNLGNSNSENSATPPGFAKRYDLRDAVLLAELNLDVLLARRNTGKSFKPLPVFPAIPPRRRNARARKHTHEAVLQTIRQAKPGILNWWNCSTCSAARTFRQAKRVWPTLLFIAIPERTLTDAEANAAHEKLVAQFKQRYRQLCASESVI